MHVCLIGRLIHQEWARSKIWGGNLSLLSISALLACCPRLRRRSGTDSQDTQMHVFWGGSHRSQAFSGQWNAPGRVPWLCGDALTGPSERDAPI